MKNDPFLDKPGGEQRFQAEEQASCYLLESQDNRVKRQKDQLAFL